MQPLTVTDVTRIATEAAREESSTVHVVGVTMGREGGRYAEVIINIEGCQTEPSRFSVGIFRDAPPAEIRQEIVGKLRRHIEEHQG